MLDTIDSMPTEEHTRYIAFKGSRVDALERLPSMCPQERLELGTNRISLISVHKRVDLLILAELDASERDSAASMMLVELHFNSTPNYQIEEFISSLQRIPGSRLH